MGSAPLGRLVCFRNAAVRTSHGDDNATRFNGRYGWPRQLHVVERWRLIEQGLTLRVHVTVNDPDTFYQPWKTYQEYARVDRPLEAEICPENNTNLFDYGMPTDSTPDF